MNGNGPHNLVLMENSTNDDTSTLLKHYNIPYIKNKGFTHAQSTDIALSNCKTKYALLVDTDIIFNKPISPLFFDLLEKENCGVIGSYSKDRGGYKLKPRINPWFCFINVDNIKKHNIKFYDKNDKRLIETLSTDFYKNIPLNFNKTIDIEMYDVGATFFEDIKSVGLRVFDIKDTNSLFTHYEGMSWYKDTNIDGFIKVHNIRMFKYKTEIEKFNNIDLTNKFI